MNSCWVSPCQCDIHIRSTYALYKHSYTWLGGEKEIAISVVGPFCLLFYSREEKKKKMNAQSKLEAECKCYLQNSHPPQGKPSFWTQHCAGPFAWHCSHSAVTSQTVFLFLKRVTMYFLFSFCMRVISERPALSENTSMHVAKDAYQDW